jgi:hypothetical protein
MTDPHPLLHRAGAVDEPLSDSGVRGFKSKWNLQPLREILWTAIHGTVLVLTFFATMFFGAMAYSAVRTQIPDIHLASFGFGIIAGSLAAFVSLYSRRRNHGRY